MRPSRPIRSVARAAKATTSPWVRSATVGMCRPTLGDLSSVLVTSDTLKSSPSPFTAMSHFPSAFVKLIIRMKPERLAGVRASSGSKSSCWKSSHHVTASSVRVRKTLPLLHVTAVGSRSLSFSTVVPLPVPDRPQSTITPPSLAAAPMSLMIISQTSCGLLPITSICMYAGGSSSSGSTPLSIEIWIPAWSFTPSSSSREMMSSASHSARPTNVSFSARSFTIVALVEASCA
mmetsp:Transcript_48079/g.109212  ORF Transcript_48079/g.109212 Transcript_48079/m.109212 type:complete len:233 (-) Transcript_48079:216-914(-)